MSAPTAPAQASASAPNDDEVRAARKRVLHSLKAHTAAIERVLPALLAALAPIDRAQSRVLLKRLSTMCEPRPVLR